ncbi:hypothetical protein [Phenylobacterium sp.]|uniref:hypothetical protein n=1 Tax=Phenylobacterium sp. TaxID=1871053 RepID=UPI0027301A96|nr:hypothetical protein [Phenylobacterium sp.]MDP2214931.1 hypothetical protein [Phenylobacterium sp.]
MLSDDARAEIRELIRAHTARNTVSAEAAQDALVRRGVLTAKGDLTPEYGGEPTEEAGGQAK